MVQLRAMTEAEFARIRALDHEDYVRSISQAYETPMPQARQEAMQQAADVLQEGMHTAGQEFLTVLAGEPPEPVGYLWCEVNREKQRAFLYYLVIDPEFRGRGLGADSLRALEARLADQGIRDLRLHVFLHNTRALQLYERQGFRTTGLNMIKHLEQRGHEKMEKGEAGADP